MNTIGYSTGEKQSFVIRPLKFIWTATPCVSRRLAAVLATQTGIDEALTLKRVSDCLDFLL